MNTNFRSSQLSLAIAPAADLPKRAASRNDLPEQLARLTEAERTILRLKALVGIATNKSDFMTVVGQAGIAGSGGVSLTNNTVNTMLNRLLSLGLLKADFSCVESLRHPLAVEMIAAPEGYKVTEAIRRIFPAIPSRPYFYSYSLQSDPGSRVRLRLAIYENDGDAYRRMIGEYDKLYSRALGPHILEELFADTILDVSWLCEPRSRYSVQAVLDQARTLSVDRPSGGGPARHSGPLPRTRGSARSCWIQMGAVASRHSGGQARRRTTEDRIDAGGGS